MYGYKYCIDLIQIDSEINILFYDNINDIDLAHGHVMLPQYISDSIVRHNSTVCRTVYTYNIIIIVIWEKVFLHYILKLMLG